MKLQCVLLVWWLGWHSLFGRHAGVPCGSLVIRCATCSSAIQIGSTFDDLRGPRHETLGSARLSTHPAHGRERTARHIGCQGQ